MTAVVPKKLNSFIITFEKLLRNSKNDLSDSPDVSSIKSTTIHYRERTPRMTQYFSCKTNKLLEI